MAERETSIRRGIDVLLALGGSDGVEQGGLSVTQIAEMLGREKSQVSRSLKTLAEYGLVDRDPNTLAYRMGWRIFTLASQASRQRLLSEGECVLQQLSADLGEQSFLSVLYGTEAVVLLSQSSSRSLQPLTWVGRAYPSYSSAPGRVLLGDHDHDTLASLFSDLSFVASGPKTVTDAEDFFVRVEECRNDGFCISDEEFEAGLVSVAAPVRDHRGRIAAAINVSGPKFRMDDHLDQTVDAVKKAAAELTQAMTNGDAQR